MLETRKPDESIRLVVVNDPAIESETDEGLNALVKYSLDRDINGLRMVPGAQPTVFVCRPLYGEARRWVRTFAGSGNEAQALAAFQACVTAIEHLRMPDGSPWLPGETVKAKWGAILSDDAIKALSAAGLDMVMEEIGSACVQLANLTPGQKKVLSLPRGYEVRPPERSTAATSPTPPGSSSKDSCPPTGEGG